jgi:hypothetical protein
MIFQDGFWNDAFRWPVGSRMMFLIYWDRCWRQDYSFTLRQALLSVLVGLAMNY